MQALQCSNNHWQVLRWETSIESLMFARLETLVKHQSHYPEEPNEPEIILTTLDIMYCHGQNARC